MHTFTPNDIMLYIGGEMPQIEANALEQQLLINTALFNYYYEMLNLWHGASNLEFQPSEGFENRLMSRIQQQEYACI
jgi:hypothetical protein